MVLNIILLILLIFLFVLSYFFSCSEAALTSLSKYHIKKIISSKKIFKKVLTKWLNSPQYFLTNILIGNNIVNILISIIITLLAVNIFKNIINRNLVEFLSWILITVLIVIFAEIIPKIYGRTNPQTVTLFTIFPVVFISKVLFPLTAPLIFIINRFTPGFSTLRRISSLSINEIKILLSESTEKGFIHKETFVLAESLINLSKLNVGDIMNPIDKMDTVNIKEDPELVIDKLLEIGRSRIPVYYKDKKRIIGIILLKNILTPGCDFNLNLYQLIKPIYFVRMDKKASTLLQEFQKGISHFAIVYDEHYNYVGFLTLEDLLEEVVGEIIDEYEYKKNQQN